jgi:mono/diheme cytochrome c family protein
MTRKSLFTITTLVALGTVIMRLLSCTSVESKPVDQSAANTMAATTKGSPESQFARGQYLVNLGGCHDCHSPKIFTPTATLFDSSKLLSGFPAGGEIPPVDEKAFGSKYWMLFNRELTAYVGPWGTTFAINLTPDSATGIGAWREIDFIRAMKTGKHLGQEGGRPILPPMPWVKFSKLSEEDLAAIFAYLRTIPPYHNKAPEAIPPPAKKG